MVGYTNKPGKNKRVYPECLHPLTDPGVHKDKKANTGLAKAGHNYLVQFEVV